MGLPEGGCPKEQVLAELSAFQKDDLRADDGRAFGYVYNAGQDVTEVQKAAVTAFMSRNGLDPTAYPSLSEIENQVVGWCLDHLNGPDGSVGSFTSGGTESCMLAVKTARDWARATKGIERPQIILPETAHSSFFKGAKYFDVEVVRLAVDPDTFAVRPSDVAEAITDRSALIVGSAPGYTHGVVDPIEALGQLAIERELMLHVDGCIGGFLLPLYEKLGQDITPFDFRVPGVTSISMDLHKYAFAPKGSSVLLFRDPEHRKHQYFACATWTGYSVVNTTIQSTKSGGPLAGAWAVMRYLGQSGYLELAKKMREGTQTLLEGISQFEQLRVLGKPEIGLIAIASDTVDVFHLADALGERGWYTQAQFGFGTSPRNLHLLVEPTNAEQAAAFLRDLESSLVSLRETEPQPVPKPLAQLAQVLTPESLRQSFDDLLGMLGVEGEGGPTLPKDRAVVNSIIDLLSPEVKETMLIEFMSRLYTPRRDQ